MFKPAKSLIFFLISALTLLLTACQSTTDLPTGAAPPTLKITKLALSERDNQPTFIIDYTLSHSSTGPLNMLNINASIFLGDKKVAYINQNNIESIEPNQNAKYTIELPVNLAGDASVDSLVNNPLLILPGSCVVQVKFTNNEALNNFNPTSSYSGFIKYEKQSSSI